jgi:hypothetical protein
MKIHLPVSRLLAFLLFFAWDSSYSMNDVPVITSVEVAAPGSGMSGYVGCKVVLRGTGFLGTKFVRINKAVVSEFTIESDNYITFKAIGVSGIISIKKDSGTGAYFGTEYTNLGFCLPGSAYVVTGGGKSCIGTNVTIGLANSQQGYEYQLYCNGVDTGLSIGGTGRAIRFENMDKAGVYTILATNAKCKLTAQMTGNATIEFEKGKIIYQDADSDGFGNPSISLAWCELRLPEGYVANKKDCDDSNASISPKAAEIGGNNIDENCDGIFEKLTVTNADITKPSKSDATKKPLATWNFSPNPFDSTFKINVVAHEVTVVKIYDVLGNLLDKIEIPNSEDQKTFELGTNYPPGVYKIIRLRGEKVHAFQIIKRQP